MFPSNESLSFGRYCRSYSVWLSRYAKASNHVLINTKRRNKEVQKVDRLQVAIYLLLSEFCLGHQSSRPNNW